MGEHAFPTVEDASQFYRAGSIGWSPRRDGRGAEAVELSTTRVGLGGGARERGRVVVLRRASARGCADRQCPRDARPPRQLAQTRDDSPPPTTGGLVVRGEVRVPTPGADSAVPARALENTIAVREDITGRRDPM